MAKVERGVRSAGHHFVETVERGARGVVHGLHWGHKSPPRMNSAVPDLYECSRRVQEHFPFLA